MPSKEVVLNDETVKSVDGPASTSETPERLHSILQGVVEPLDVVVLRKLV